MKKEYIVLVVIIALAIVYLAVHKTNRSQYQLPEIPEMDSKAISKLEIAGPDETIVLNRKDNRWYIAPQEYLADDEAVEPMLDAIDDLTLTALVSETKSFVRYDLHEEKKITVRAWAGSTMEREFEMGKAAPTYQHTFVHLPDDLNIYHARGNFRYKFEKTPDKLRDKTVLSFEKEQAQRILLARGEDSEELIFKPVAAEESEDKAAEEADETEETVDAEPPEPEMAWQTPEGKSAEKTDVDALLILLAELKCESYIDDKTKEDFKSPGPAYRLELSGAEDASLSIFDKVDEDADDHPGISSESDYPFFLSETRAKSITEKIDKLLEP